MEHYFHYFQDTLLMNATLKALRHLSNPTPINEIDKSVAVLEKIPADILSIPHPKDRRTEFQYRMAWARTRLKEEGLIINPKLGYWELTQKGKDYFDRVLKDRNYPRDSSDILLTKEILSYLGALNEDDRINYLLSCLHSLGFRNQKIEKSNNFLTLVNAQFECNSLIFGSYGIAFIKGIDIEKTFKVLTLIKDKYNLGCLIFIDPSVHINENLGVIDNLPGIKVLDLSAFVELMKENHLDVEERTVFSFSPLKDSKAT